MKSRLITTELAGCFAPFPLYKQDGLSREAICVCCFRIGHIRWYVLEGQAGHDDFIIFGIIIGMGETEYGYSDIKEMEGINVTHPIFPLSIGQDPSICNVPTGSINDKELQDFLASMEGETWQRSEHPNGSPGL